jgi:fucose permease
MKPKSKHAATQTILIAFLTFIGLGLTSGLLGVAWPYMQAEFNLALDTVTALLVAQTITYTLASFLIGRLMARFGSGLTLAVGILVILLGLLGVATAPSWFLIVVYSFIAGFGVGSIDAGLNLYLTAYHSAREMNWLHACFGIGITLGPLLMTYSVVHYTWRVGYAMSGGALLVVLVLLLVSRRLWRNEGFQSAENTPVRRASFGETLRLPVVWFSMLTFLAYVAIEIGIGQWTYTLFTQSRGIAPETAGMWVSVYWGVFTGGRIFFGFIANRFDPTRLIRWCMAVMVVGTVLLAWNPVPMVGFIGLIITGFAEAPIFAMLMMATPERMGLEHAENGVSLQMMCIGVGSAVLQGLIGTIGKTFGLETMTITFVVIAVISLVAHELAHLAHTARPVLSTAEG